MTEAELLKAVEHVRTWHVGEQRAPHKPLLLLLALGRLQAGKPRIVPFEEVETPLRELLRTFGPSRASYHPEYPFWWLRSDGLWEVPEAAALSPRQSGNGPSVSEMRNASGGLPAEVDALLRSRPDLVRVVVHAVLDEHFSDSLHEDILAATGLDIHDFVVGPRDPAFRKAVLDAYGYHCAVCDMDALLDGLPAVLEAAHVRMHTHGGPGTVDNGLCLCPLHHKAFDVGAIGVTEDRRVAVSAKLHGGQALEAMVGRFHGRVIIGPVHGHPPVRVEHVRWHTREVFKGPARP